MSLWCRQISKISTFFWNTYFHDALFRRYRVWRNTGNRCRATSLGFYNFAFSSERHTSTQILHIEFVSEFRTWHHINSVHQVTKLPIVTTITIQFPLMKFSDLLKGSQKKNKPREILEYFSIPKRNQLEDSELCLYSCRILLTFLVHMLAASVKPSYCHVPKWLWTRFWLGIWFIKHLQIVTTSN
jgi:hypothetical protein